MALLRFSGFYLFLQPFSMHFQWKRTKNLYFLFVPLGHQTLVASLVPYTPTYGDALAHGMGAGRAVRLQPFCFFFAFMYIFNRKQHRFTYNYMQNVNNEASGVKKRLPLRRKFLQGTKDTDAVRLFVRSFVPNGIGCVSR